MDRFEFLRIWGISIVLGLITISVGAQQFDFRPLSIKDGLPNSYVYALCEDGNGSEISLLLFIIFLRTYNLQKAKILLEEQVENRAKELRLQKEKLEKQKVQLEEATRVKSDFLATMSHEIKTPCHHISLRQCTT